MARDQARDWMWSEALQMLAQAERLHRQVFRPVPSAHGVSWEPPVDVLETKDAVLILAALPGVDPDQVQAVIEDGTLLISGERSLPDEVKTAVMLRRPGGRLAGGNREEVGILAGQDLVDHRLDGPPRIGRVVGHVVARRVDARDFGTPIFGQKLIGVAVPGCERPHLGIVETLEAPFFNQRDPAVGRCHPPRAARPRRCRRMR